MLATLKAEIGPLARLAWPLVLAELGWMTMGIVDTIFVGRFSTEALAGVSLGGIFFYSISLFGLGILLGLDTLVSQAYGANDRDECGRWAATGIWMALLISPPLMGFIWLLIQLMPMMGVRPEVVDQARPFMLVLNWSLAPLLLFAALRRYLQSMNIVLPVMLLMLSVCGAAVGVGLAQVDAIERTIPENFSSVGISAPSGAPGQRSNAP